MGHGIKAKVKGKDILAGNKKLMDVEKIAYVPAETTGTIVYVAINKNFAGSIIISDELKNDSKDAIKELKAVGVSKIVMLTGDNENVGTKVAEQLK